MTLTADTVRGMSGFEGQGDDAIDERLEMLLERIALIPGDMLENEVYQRFDYLLCRRCRDIVAANPLNRTWE